MDRKDEIDAALDKFAEEGAKAWAGVSSRELRGEKEAGDPEYELVKPIATPFDPKDYWNGEPPKPLAKPLAKPPQTAPDERETSFLYLRCQPADKSSWVKAAQRKGQKLTEWVKDVLRREANRP